MGNNAVQGIKWGEHESQLVIPKIRFSSYPRLAAWNIKIRLQLECAYDAIRSSNLLVLSHPKRKLLRKIRFHLIWSETIQTFTVYRCKTLLDKRTVSQIDLWKVSNWFQFFLSYQVCGFLVMTLFVLDAIIYFRMYLTRESEPKASAPAVPT